MKRLLFAVMLLIMTVSVWTSAFAQNTPSQDSYTNTATSTTNFGTAVTLGVVNSATSIQNAYIQFDLSSVPAGYTSNNVAKATLKLYVASVAKAGTFNIDFVNGAWTEKTITESLAPALGTTIASGVSLTSANVNDYVLIDVTTAVGEWLNGSQANDGIALVANSPLSATFDSKENTAQSHPAELDIVFTAGGTISGVTTASGSGLAGGGTSGTLSLSLQKTCSTNQVLQWNGSSWICASVGTGTITGVTAGTDLVGGGTSGGVVLSVDTTKVPQLVASNTFTGNQSVAGNITASGTLTATTLSGNGAAVTNVNAATLNGLASSSFASLTANNTFPADQFFNGNSIAMFVGDPGCGKGYAGLGFGGLNGCVNYSMIGDGTNTFFNRPTGGSMFFREGNGTEMSIAPGGAMSITMSSNAAYNPALTVTSAVEGNTAIQAYGGGGATEMTSGGSAILAIGGTETNTDSFIGGDGLDAYGGQAYQGGVGIYAQGGVSNWVGGGDALDTWAGNGNGAQGYSAFFQNGEVNVNGDLGVTGAIYAGTKDFRIDHPLDPANKYLFHASVESSEMMNIYTGNVMLDGNGAAVITLPDWFEALNTDFRYQLTAIGAAAPNLHVAAEVANNQFSIAGGVPGMKVSWSVTAVRHDAFAKAHPLVVEQPKADKERGFYLHPDLFGQPDEQQVEWGKFPQKMRHLKDLRNKDLRNRAPQPQAAQQTAKQVAKK